jgi:hypothetical protein
MLKKPDQAITIIAFLIANWRDAVGHGGDYEIIMSALGGYLDAIKEGVEMTDKELDILYLKGKIKADGDQWQRHKVELSKLLNEEN